MLIGNKCLGLSIIPVHNLTTFFNATNSEVLQLIPSKLRRDIVQSREAFDARFRGANGRLLPLGPLRWGEEAHKHIRGWPMKYVNSYGERTPASEKSTNLVDLVQTMARNEVKNISLRGKQNSELKIEELKSEKTQTSLAAYYLFTSFGQDLAAIHRLLSIKNPAKDVLWVHENLDFHLHDEHVSLMRTLAPLGGITFPEETREKPKSWLATIGNRISSAANSIAGKRKSVPSTATDSTETASDNHTMQSAELGDDEIRSPFMVKGIQSRDTTHSTPTDATSQPKTKTAKGEEILPIVDLDAATPSSILTIAESTVGSIDKSSPTFNVSTSSFEHFLKLKAEKRAEQRHQATIARISMDTKPSKNLGTLKEKSMSTKEAMATSNSAKFHAKQRIVRKAAQERKLKFGVRTSRVQSSKRREIATRSEKSIATDSTASWSTWGGASS